MQQIWAEAAAEQPVGPIFQRRRLMGGFRRGL
jgi:hypothetical protein